MINFRPHKFTDGLTKFNASRFFVIFSNFLLRQNFNFVNDLCSFFRSIGGSTGLKNEHKSLTKLTFCLNKKLNFVNDFL